MFKDYMTGNWRNNALADAYRQPHVTRDIEQYNGADSIGFLGGGGGYANQFQQSQFQAPQPQWQGVDQTQWQPQYAQPQGQPTQYAQTRANPLSSYTQPMQYQNALSMYSRGWG